MKARCRNFIPAQDTRIFANQRSFEDAVEQEFLRLYEKTTEDISVQLIAIQLYVEELEHHHTTQWLRKHMESIFRVTDMLATGFSGFGKSVPAIDIVKYYKDKGIDIDAEYRRHTWGAAQKKEDAHGLTENR